MDIITKTNQVLSDISKIYSSTTDPKTIETEMNKVLNSVVYDNTLSTADKDKVFASILGTYKSEKVYAKIIRVFQRYNKIEKMIPTLDDATADKFFEKLGEKDINAIKKNVEDALKGTKNLIYIAPSDAPKVKILLDAADRKLASLKGKPAKPAKPAKSAGTAGSTGTAGSAKKDLDQVPENKIASREGWLKFLAFGGLTLASALSPATGILNTLLFANSMLMTISGVHDVVSANHYDHSEKTLNNAKHRMIGNFLLSDIVMGLGFGVAVLGATVGFLEVGVIVSLLATAIATKWKVDSRMGYRKIARASLKDLKNAKNDVKKAKKNRFKAALKKVFRIRFIHSDADNKKVDDDYDDARKAVKAAKAKVVTERSKDEVKECKYINLDASSKVNAVKTKASSIKGLFVSPKLPKLIGNGYTLNREVKFIKAIFDNPSEDYEAIYSSKTKIKPEAIKLASSEYTLIKGRFDGSKAIQDYMNNNQSTLLDNLSYMYYVANSSSLTGKTKAKKLDDAKTKVKSDFGW